MAASTGIISSARTDPNAATASTDASTTPGAATVTPAAVTGSNISTAPTPSTSSGSGDSEASYLNQLNAGAGSSAAPAASTISTPATPTTSSSAPATGGIISSAMNSAPATTSAAPAAPRAVQKDASQPVASNPIASNTATTSNASVAPAVAPATSTASAPATAADISADFSANFGRPAANAGLTFYENELANNPGMTQAQLNAEIAGGAQSQDRQAAASLNGNGAISSNWTNPNLNPGNVATGQDVWDAATNSWTTAPAANGVPTSAATYNATQLGTPTQLNVGAQQTVQGQLANINNPNSPIIMAARNSANQQANANGLLNSTMAISAGDAAAYNAAIPIAEQDATTYNNAAAANASAANTFAVDNQNATNTANQYNAGSTNTLTGEQLSNQTSLSNAQLAAQTSTANQAAQDTTNQAIAQLNAANSATMQTQTTLAGVQSTYANWINQIQQSSIADKTDAMSTALQTTVASYVALGGNATNLLASMGATSIDGKTSLTADQIASGTPFDVAGVTYKMQNGVPVAQSGADSGVPSASGNGTVPPTGAADGSTYIDKATGTAYIVVDGYGIAINNVTQTGGGNENGGNGGG